MSTSHPLKVEARFERSGGPESGFVDGSGRPGDGMRAIFPIISGIDGVAWRPVATGFFVSNNGFFATAKHVVTDESGHILRDLAGVQLLPGENRARVRQIRHLALHPVADVAVGLLADPIFDAGGPQTLNATLRVTLKVPQVRTKVATVAFPNSEVHIREQGRDLEFTSDVTLSEIEEYLPAGRDRVMLPGRCFRIGATIKSGASGGPAALSHGAVFGINSTGIDGTEIGYVSSVIDLLDLHVPRNLSGPPGGELVSVQDLFDRGYLPAWSSD